MRVLIVCPIGVKTGGPQALHQLCHELNLLGIDSYLVPATPGKVQVEPSFSKYIAPLFDGTSFEPDDFLVVPETILFLSPEFKNIDNRRTFIWWLSVDNSPLPWMNNYEIRNNSVNLEWGERTIASTTRFNAIYERLFEINFALLAASPSGKLHRINPKKVNNLCQSAYAMSVLSTRGLNNLSYLSDYVEVERVRETFSSIRGNGKTRVVYNFAKSYKQVEILKSMDEAVDFIPLSGLSATEIALLVQSADLFLDLGHFPGKDRLPREAILLGCPVLLAKRGAARHQKDFPLGDDFLIDLESETPNNTLSKIYRISSDKESALAKQEGFLSNVLQQKMIFSNEVKELKFKLESIQGAVA